MLDTNAFAFLTRLTAKPPRLIAQASGVFQDRVIAVTPSGTPLEFFGDYNQGNTTITNGMWFVYEGSVIVDTLPNVDTVTTVYV